MPLSRDLDAAGRRAEQQHAHYSDRATMDRPRLAVLVTAVAFATGVAGCGGSGRLSPARASHTGAVRGTARAPTLAEVRHGLAGLPAWQRKVMLKQWEIMRSSEQRGCPTEAELHKLTVRLDAVAARKASGAAFVVLGCRTSEHGR